MAPKSFLFVEAYGHNDIGQVHSHAAREYHRAKRQARRTPGVRKRKLVSRPVTARLIPSPFDLGSGSCDPCLADPLLSSREDRMLMYHCMVPSASQLIVERCRRRQADDLYSRHLRHSLNLPEAVEPFRKHYSGSRPVSPLSPASALTSGHSARRRQSSCKAVRLALS
jgi:hypothetical protein